MGTSVSLSGYTIVQEEGVNLPPRYTLDFQGAGVTAAEVLGKTVITIPGSGVSTPILGSFYDTTTQSTASGVAKAMELNTTDISAGVSITNNALGRPTRMTVNTTGIYNLQFSAQLVRSVGGSAKEINIWSIMKKIFALSLLLVFVTSCSLEKRLAKYCPLCTQKDSTVTVIEYRDTTITIPGETVFIEDSLYCDSLGRVYAVRLSEKDGTIISLQSKLSKNKYKVVATMDTVYKVIEGNTVYKTKVVTKTLKPQKIKYVPGFINFLAWLGGIFLIIIILNIIYRVLKAQIKPL